MADDLPLFRSGEMYVRFAHLHLPVDLLNFRIVLLNTRTESLNLLFELSNRRLKILSLPRNRCAGQSGPKDLHDYSRRDLAARLNSTISKKEMRHIRIFCWTRNRLFEMIGALENQLT
jgi:hypothetical protein